MKSSTCLLAAALLAAVPVARADPFFVGGTFTGIVQAETLPLNFEPPHPASWYDGATVTGRFEVCVPDPQPAGDYALNAGGWLALSYTIRGETFAFRVDASDPLAGNAPSVILLTPAWRDGGPQRVDFLTEFMPRYDGASFGLSGPPGSLFDGVDPTTLHLDADHPPGFDTGFASSTAEMRFAITTTAFTIAALAPVPEPADGALLLAGIAGLSIRRLVVRRREGGWQGV